MTPRERQTLSFIEHYQAQHSGVSPTLQEIADGLGFKSRGNVQAFVNGLERQGYITKDASRSRGINVVGSAGDLSGISDGALLVELARRGLLKVVGDGGDVISATARA